MEIYDGSGEIHLEPDEAQTFLDLMSQHSRTNRIRYELQAKELLSQGSLLVPMGKSVLKYIVKDGWAGYKVSEDSGLDYSNFLTLMPLPRRRRSKIENLIEHFAHGEASQTLRI
ncbi:MAG: hypothetical protein H7227_00645 [Actinobacteria bacterium]|nr:hypothetical protein [Actinomycetota bacterium]